LEAANQAKTVAELARTYPVHPVPISQWRKQLRGGVIGAREQALRRRRDISERLGNHPHW
jgi:transposase-like protein